MFAGFVCWSNSHWTGSDHTHGAGHTFCSVGAQALYHEAFMACHKWHVHMLCHRLTHNPKLIMLPPATTNIWHVPMMCSRPTAMPPCSAPAGLLWCILAHRAVADQHHPRHPALPQASSLRPASHRGARPRPRPHQVALCGTSRSGCPLCALHTLHHRAHRQCKPGQHLFQAPGGGLCHRERAAVLADGCRHLQHGQTVAGLLLWALVHAVSQRL